VKLTDLKAKFIRWEDRVEPIDKVDGDISTPEGYAAWVAAGRPSVTVVGPRTYVPRVATLAEAQGISFLCPACSIKNGGPIGTHIVQVAFRDRGVLDHQGSRSRNGGPSRWAVSGTGLHDLTTDPSIDCGCWHGWIRNGDAT
jgi:hypothetical protein